MNNIAQELENYKNSISNYKRIIEDYTRRKLIEQNNLEHIVKREQEVIEEITSKGINPNELTSTINNKMDSIRNIMSKLDSIIPQDGSIPNNVEELVGSITQANSVNVEVSTDNIVDNLTEDDFTFDDDFPL